MSPDNKSSLIDNEQIEGTSIVEYFGLTPYVNTKFGAYQSIFGNTTNASDWPLMRVEEMYFIEAEAIAASQGGKRWNFCFGEFYENLSLQFLPMYGICYGRFS